jgi:hypothetical protein
MDRVIVRGSDPALDKILRRGVMVAKTVDTSGSKWFAVRRLLSS